MGNLTLDVFWTTFLPIYLHTIGALTTLLSVLAFYLMITKTPQYGKPLARYLMLLQLSIVIVDFGWGFLLCPVFLFPLTAILCSGFICDTLISDHAGIVLNFQFMIQVALMVTYILHHKYTTIAQMKNGREATQQNIILTLIACISTLSCKLLIVHLENMEKNLVRLFFLVVLELPVIGAFMCGASRQDLHEYLLVEEQFSLATMIETHPALHGIGYSIPRHLWILILEAAFVLTSATICVGAGVFFVSQTLRMLSVKTSTMSEKTRKLQRGLTITLVMQLTVPLAIQIVPIFICVLSMINTWFSPASMNFLLCVLLCHATVHTVLLISTTPSYRMAITCSTSPKDASRAVSSIVKI